MRIGSLGEDRLIEELAARFPSRGERLVKGIGDDTSVTVQKGGRALLATTDTLIEGTHFDLGYTPAYLLGRKSLSISLSDIAAMGGDPLFFLVSIALEPRTPKKFIDELYRGLGDVAREAGCLLAGGNTARTAGPISVSTTVLGEAPANEVVYRRGARTGDLVFVTGTVGSSALGLRVLSERKGAAKRGSFKEAVSRHLDPVPRLEAGKALAGKGLATAMMDISDGVALDLKRLCLESSKAAVVLLGSLPVSAELEAWGRKTRTDARLEFALSGGEDYELLFTSPEENLRKIAALSRRLGLPMTPVGRIVGRKKGRKAVTVLGEDGAPIEVERLGFEHF